MLFIEPFFLMVFLPVVLAAFWGTSRLAGGEAGLAVLLTASILFYGKFGLGFCALLLVSIAINFVVGAYLAGSAASPQRRKLALLLGLMWNFGALIYFKYLLSLEGLFSSTAVAPPGVIDLAIPVGISFYTFHQAVFLLDAHARKPVVMEYLGGLHGMVGKLKAAMRYAAFVCFFPQLVIGPIVYLQEFAASVRRPDFGRFKRSDVEVGLTLAAIGMFEKLVIADGLAPMAGSLFTVAAAGAVVDAATAWTGVVAYYLQLYFDFSGYSDMAIGLARVVGVRLPINFDSPLRASGIADFYRRWHITLTRCIARFLFTPLSLWGTRTSLALKLGRRGQKLFSSWLPLLVNFEIIALWHGARGTFLLFGVIHGLWYILETEMKASKTWREWARRRSETSVRRWGQAATVLPLMLTFALFASPDLESFRHVLQGLIGTGGGDAMAIAPRSLGVLLLAIVIVWLTPNSVELLGRYRPGDRSWINPSTTPALLGRMRWRPNLAWGAFFTVVTAASFLSMAHKAPFLYQGF